MAVADLHGHLPPVPECDLLLLPGDVSWGQERNFLLGPFADWLAKVPGEVVWIAGNHEFEIQDDPEFARTLPGTYLQDETVAIDGEVIHGSPWSLPFFDWAFMAEEEELEKKAALIPDDTTILLTHGPPYGVGDLAARGVLTGSTSYAKRARELEHLKLYVFGHIHESRGEWREGNAIWANVSLVDLTYHPHPLQLPQWDL